MQYIAITENSLMHVGVKGMHWGQRKKQPLAVTSVRKKVDDTAANMKKVKKEFGKKSDEYKSAKDQFKKANSDRNAEIASKSSKMYDHKTLMGKLLDDPASRLSAATYVVDHNMSYKEASAKADKEAIAYTVAALAIYGGLKYAEKKYLQ